MRRAIDFLRMALAWFTYRGWGNQWWREDWAMATCKHPKEDVFVVNRLDAYCMACGAAVRP